MTNEVLGCFLWWWSRRPSNVLQNSQWKHFANFSIEKLNVRCSIECFFLQCWYVSSMLSNRYVSLPSMQHIEQVKKISSGDELPSNLIGNNCINFNFENGKQMIKTVLFIGIHTFRWYKQADGAIHHSIKNQYVAAIASALMLSECENALQITRTRIGFHPNAVLFRLFKSFVEHRSNTKIARTCRNFMFIQIAVYAK